jgi:hypothetical protein
MTVRTKGGSHYLRAAERRQGEPSAQSPPQKGGGLVRPMTLTAMADLHIPEALSNGGVPLDGLVVLFSAQMSSKYGHVVSDAARLAGNAIAGEWSLTG